MVKGILKITLNSSRFLTSPRSSAFCAPLRYQLSHGLVTTALYFQQLPTSFSRNSFPLKFIRKTPGGWESKGGPQAKLAPTLCTGRGSPLPASTRPHCQPRRTRSTLRSPLATNSFRIHSYEKYVRKSFRTYSYKIIGLKVPPNHTLTENPGGRGYFVNQADRSADRGPRNTGQTT
jgi:hypothetical protein